MAARGDPASRRPSGAARGPQAGLGAPLRGLRSAGSAGPRITSGVGRKRRKFSPLSPQPNGKLPRRRGRGCAKGRPPLSPTRLPPQPRARGGPELALLGAARARPLTPPNTVELLPRRPRPPPQISAQRIPTAPTARRSPRPSPHTGPRSPGQGNGRRRFVPPAPSSGRRRGAGKGKRARSPRPYLILAEPGSPPPPPAVWAAQAGSPLPSAPPPGAAILAVTGAGGGGRRLVIAGAGWFHPHSTARSPSGGHGAGAERGGPVRLSTPAEEGGSLWQSRSAAGRLGPAVRASLLSLPSQGRLLPWATCGGPQDPAGQWNPSSTARNTTHRLPRALLPPRSHSFSLSGTFKLTRNVSLAQRSQPRSPVVPVGGAGGTWKTERVLWISRRPEVTHTRLLHQRLWENLRQK